MCMYETGIDTHSLRLDLRLDLLYAYINIYEQVPNHYFSRQKTISRGKQPHSGGTKSRVAVIQVYQRTCRR